jgi:segregation and condensation protein A
VSDYRVQLDVFTGPLDLLLYLIRRDEVDILDIPLARITEQYLEHVRVLEHLDPDAAADFLLLAATLLEIKSRSLLPTPAFDDDGAPDDPRTPLVRQLLEYKRFKDAAAQLGTAAQERAKRYVRVPAELPAELQGVELEEAQIWDLLAAFGKVMTAIGRGPGVHEVRYDDVPIELHAAEILAILAREAPTTFEALFDGPPDRMLIIGRFLALLELIRSHRVRAEQAADFGTIYLFVLQEAPPDAPEAAPEPGAAAADDGEGEYEPKSVFEAALPPAPESLTAGADCRPADPSAAPVSMDTISADEVQESCDEPTQ